MVTLSTTVLKDAATCLKLFSYKHVDHLAPKPGDFPVRMRKGIWIHRGLEYRAHGKSWAEGLNECRDWARERGVPDEKTDELRLECDRILRGYFAYYDQQPYWQWKSLGAEMPLTYTLSKGVTLQATIDELVEWRGQRWIVEHKTTIEVPSPTWRGIDPQTSLQLILAGLNGLNVAGVVFNYISTREPAVPRVKKDGRFYAQSADSRTSSTAFDVAEGDVYLNWKHDDKECGAPSPKSDGTVYDHDTPTCAGAYLEQMRNNMVNDDQFYQRFEVYKNAATLEEALRDIAGVGHQIATAQARGHYPRLNNIVYCQRFCSFSTLCAAEQIAGRKLEVLRETDYVIDDGTDREGRGTIE